MSINRTSSIPLHAFRFTLEEASGRGVHVLYETRRLFRSIQNIQSIWITNGMYREIRSLPYFRALPPLTDQIAPEIYFNDITDFLKFVSAVRIHSTVVIENHDDAQQGIITIPLRMYEDLRPTLHPIREVPDITPAETELSAHHITPAETELSAHHITPAETELSELQIFLPELSSLPDNEFQKVKQELELALELALALEEAGKCVSV